VLHIRFVHWEMLRTTAVVSRLEMSFVYTRPIMAGNKKRQQELVSQMYNKSHMSEKRIDNFSDMRKMNHWKIW
jgi:hypothetical protein